MYEQSWRFEAVIFNAPIWILRSILIFKKFKNKFEKIKFWGNVTESGSERNNATFLFRFVSLFSSVFNLTILISTEETFFWPSMQFYSLSIPHQFTWFHFILVVLGFCQILESVWDFSKYCRHNWNQGQLKRDLNSLKGPGLNSHVWSWSQRANWDEIRVFQKCCSSGT